MFIANEIPLCSLQPTTSNRHVLGKTTTGKKGLKTLGFFSTADEMSFHNYFSAETGLCFLWQ